MDRKSTLHDFAAGETGRGPGVPSSLTNNPRSGQWDGRRMSKRMIADYEAPEPDPPTLAPEGDEGVTAAPGLTDAADYEPTRLRVGRIGGAELSAAPQSAGLAPSGSAPAPAPAGSVAV